MRRLLVIAATLASVGISSTMPAISAVNRCDAAWSKCNYNAGKCQNQDRCMNRCDQKFSACKP